MRDSREAQSFAHDLTIAMPFISRGSTPCSLPLHLRRSCGHGARAFPLAINRYWSPRSSHPIFALKPATDSSGLRRRPKILIFDEAVSNLDQQTAELFALTINKLKGKVTMIFITHQIPRGLQVDEVFSFGDKPQRTTNIGVGEDGK